LALAIVLCVCGVAFSQPEWTGAEDYMKQQAEKRIQDSITEAKWLAHRASQKASQDSASVRTNLRLDSLNFLQAGDIQQPNDTSVVLVRMWRYEAYINRFPAGAFVAAARESIAALEPRFSDSLEADYAKIKSKSTHAQRVAFLTKYPTDHKYYQVVKAKVDKQGEIDQLAADICDQRETIRTTNEALQMARKGAEYSGYVDKKTMYDLGLGKAYTEQDMAQNKKKFLSLTGRAWTAKDCPKQE
jgi:hypothetical protein